MALFEKIGDKISSAGKDVAKKTKEIADITKINLQISNEEDNIKNLYNEIGKLYYEVHKNSPDAKMAVLCASITESINKIDLSKKQIQIIKGIIRCPKCGAENADSSAFCGTCGYKNSITPEVIEDNTTKSKCPNCGEVFDGTGSFCSNCGGKI